MNRHRLHQTRQSTTGCAALYALGALSPEEQTYYEEHLNSCASCRSELQGFQKVAHRLAAPASPNGPSAELRNRVLARIDREASGEVATAPAGILLQKTGLLISRSANMPWQPIPIPGMKAKTLFFDTDRNYSTSLVSMDPGSVYPPHRHDDIEEVYVLEGDLLVEGVQMRPGDYCRSEPGSIHGAARTTSGVLLLVLSSQRDELLS